MKKPVVLCILDGVGIRDEIKGNAVKNANMPMFNYLLHNYPNSLLEASGKKVGLPEGQMGNSEVGHMNIGAGRIVYQPLELINSEIENKNFFKNKNILEVINHVKENNSKLHIMGLLSDGGVHSHINHLLSLIDMCKLNNVKDVYFDLFLDGRDTFDHSAYNYIKILEDKLQKEKFGNISTISGRYYAMDRDNNWDRVKLSYDAIVNGIGEHYSDIKTMIDVNYENNVTDEFMKPTVFYGENLEENDGVIVFNFRPDRIRELFTAITNHSFDSFETKKFSNLKLVTMMPVSESVICSNAYELQNLKNTLGEYISKKGLSQLRIAETEKYAHVTYFFDGGVEKKLENTKRVLIKSPSVATYDLKPSMSADEVTDSLLKELDTNSYDVVILNYANGDMVGHTGNYKATIEALEFLDDCLKKLYDKVKEKEGILIVTADHGNSDEMFDQENKVVTSHTTSKVPFIISKKGLHLKDGKLADIAPTLLSLLNIEIPKEMTGDNLIVEVENEQKN